MLSNKTCRPESANGGDELWTLVARVSPYFGAVVIGAYDLR